MPEPSPRKCMSPVVSARSVLAKRNLAKRSSSLSESKFEVFDQFKMRAARHVDFLQEVLLREHEQAMERLRIMAQDLQRDNNELRRQLDLPISVCARSECSKETNTDFCYWTKELTSLGELAYRDASRAEKVELPGRLIVETCEPVPEDDEAVISAKAKAIDGDLKRSSLASGNGLGPVVDQVRSSRSPSKVLTNEIHAKDFIVRREWTKELNSKADRIAGPPPMLDDDDDGGDYVVTYTSSTVAYPRCVMSPHSEVLVGWHLLFMVVLLYEMLLIPMGSFDMPEDGAYRIASIFCMMFWTLDLPLTANTAFVSKDGKVVVRHRTILKNYAKGWLAPDVLLILIDWMEFSGLADATAGGVLRGGKAVKAFRLLRVLRILRMRKLREVLATFDEFINSQYFTIIISMILNVCAILLISHFIGCLWFLIGSTKVPGYPSWVERYSFTDTDWEYQYLTSLHWSITQFTPGSMSVQPQNIGERAYAIAVLVAGMIIFSSIVSSITAATNGLKAMNARYKREVWMMRKFCKEQHISQLTLQQIMRYAENFIQPKMNKARATEVYLLAELPDKMHAQVMYEIFNIHLRKHPLFRKLDTPSAAGRNTLADICTTCVEDRLLDEREILFTPGQQAHHMFIMMDGKLKYHALLGQPDELGSVDFDSGNIVTDRKILGVNKEHCFIAEAVLWTEWVFQGTCTALVPSKLLALHYEAFHRTIAEHRVDYLMLRKYAKAYVDEMNELAGNTTEEDDDDRNLSDVLGELLPAVQLLEQYDVRGSNSLRQSGGSFAG